MICAPGYSQVYPSKNVRLVVPFAAGGGSDTVARLIATELTKNWGQQILVDNRPGANGMIATEFVAKSPADGYTLLVTEVGGLVIRTVMIQKLGFDFARDFGAVAMGAYGANVVVVHPSIPAKSTRELIALAKARPGQLNFAAPGIGSVAHLAGVEIEQQLGVRWTYIPFKGGAPAIVDLVGGHADFGVAGLLTATPHLKSGRLRGLAVASRERHPGFPELPTLTEGGVPHVSGSWQGLLAPAGVPRDIVAKWNAEVERLNATPAMRERYASFGAVAGTMKAEQMQTFLVSERARWASVVSKAQIKAE